jgi:hypothetical protein
MYKFDKLFGFVGESIRSSNPLIKSAANDLADMLMPGTMGEEDEEVVDSDVEKDPSFGNSEPQQEEDQILDQAMPELEQPNKFDKSPFGQIKSFINLTSPVVHKTGSVLDHLKRASAYINDIDIKELPKDVQLDIRRFIPVDKDISVVQYGMVVKELLPKVDKHNYEQAKLHISKEYVVNKKMKDEFFEKAKNKYIFILNDKIIDGHHFLAKAQALGITSSLKVLDLTPIRFQEKTSMLNILRKRYVKNHNRRKNTPKALSSKRSPRVYR